MVDDKQHKIASAGNTRLKVGREEEYFESTEEFASLIDIKLKYALRYVRRSALFSRRMNKVEEQSYYEWIREEEVVFWFWTENLCFACSQNIPQLREIDTR